MTEPASPPPLPTSTGPRLAPWMPLLVVAVAWAAQGGVLRNGWVWDDAVLIRDGATVARGVAAIPSLLVSTWGAGEGKDVGLYRPLVSASLALQASLHGVGDPFPFHLVNLFLHGAVAVAFLALVNRLLPSRPTVSATAALLFAAHPLHTGTVSWIVARGDLMAALFSLLAALAWTRPKGLDAAAVALTAVLWFLGLLSKEMAGTLPLILLGIDAWAPGRGGREALVGRWKAYVALALPLLAYLALRHSALGGLVPEATAPLAGRSLLERAFIGAGELVRMGVRLAVPVGTTGDASNDPVLASAQADLPFAYAASAALVGAFLLVAGLRRLGGRGGLPTFLCVAFFVTSLPVLQLLVTGTVFEDRFAYLPSLAFLPLAGLAAERLLRVRPRVVPLGFLALVLAALVPASWAVAADWRDDATFDRALLEDDPGHLRALDRLSRALLVQGLAERREAMSLPVTAGGRLRALQASSAAHVSEAVRLLERASALPAGRTHPGILRSRGDAYLALPSPRFADALASYKDLLAVKRVRVAGRWVPWTRLKDPSRVLPADRATMAQIYDNVAIAEIGVAADDLVARVAEARERAASWTPDDYERQRLSGAAWLAADEPGPALMRLERAVLLAPPSEAATARASLADAREHLRARADEAYAKGLAANRRVGAHNEALSWFDEAVRLDPSFVRAHVERARVLRYKGNLTGALDALRTAGKLLDAAKAPADAPDRALVAQLTKEYRDAQVAPDPRDEEGMK